jgi:anti-sigma B factor antagonist
VSHSPIDFFVDVTVDASTRTTFVAPHGELDLATRPELEEALADALGHARRVVLDLRGLSFIDSSGLRVLVDTELRARATDVGFAIRDGTPVVAHVLQITGLADHFERDEP